MGKWVRFALLVTSDIQLNSCHKCHQHLQWFSSRETTNPTIHLTKNGILNATLSQLRQGLQGNRCLCAN